MRRGWRVIAAACAAGLIWSGPAALAAPRGSLPGPLPGCPPQQGVAAPASTPWAQQMLRFSSVWHLTGGGGVTVAVVDSGVDASPQFGRRVITGPDLAAAGPAGATARYPRNADCVGHGTSMASIIGAAPVAGVSFTGVAPAARILSIKISSSDTFPTAVTPQAIRDAVKLGASVINLSLATADDVPALRSAVDFALRSNVVVVAAAGNDAQQAGGGQGGNTAGASGPFYPAAYPGVLSVGAVGPDGALASFSDRQTPVSVTAPGVNITSAYPGVFPDAYDPVQNGTSFAAAFVSGVAALVRSCYPRLDEAQVVARIEATARGPAGPGTGHGLVNPVRAVTAALPPARFAGGASPGPASANASASAASGGQNGHPRHTAPARAAPSGPSARTVALAVIAGSFGLMIVVAAARVIPAARRRRF